MKHDLQLEPAFVLHRRPYRDTSILVDFFTQNYGVLTAVARGVRSAKSPLRGILQPFIPLLITGRGKNLLTLYQAEVSGVATYLVQEKLTAGLYLNELLMKLLEQHDAHPQLFQAYHQAVIQLIHDENLELTLRLFEMQLINELGYGLQFDKTHDGQVIEADKLYFYRFGVGFCQIENLNHSTQMLTLPGEHLQALEQSQFYSAEILQSAKRLFRLIIKHLLPDKTINARELYIPS